MRSLPGSSGGTDWLLVPIEAAVGILYSWVANRLVRRREWLGPSGGASVRPLPSLTLASKLRKAA